MIPGVQFLTQPTPLIFADDASHVIATFSLLDNNFTAWTLKYISLSFKPSFKFTTQLALALL
jgi:hypothetical protein